MGFRHVIRFERKAVKHYDPRINSDNFWFENVIGEFEKAEKVLDFNGLDANLIIPSVIALKFKGIAFPAVRLQREAFYLELVLKDCFGAMKRDADIGI
jgi:hypothetical protein